MCAGYGFHTPGLKQRYRVETADFRFEARYNIRPTQYAPIIYEKDDKRIASKAKFGLIPSWAKDPKIGYTMINARSETVMEKPSYRGPFKSQRCLIPADYFVEWAATQHGKQPYMFRLKTRQPFAMAGLYDIWRDAEKYPVITFCILTTTPNPLVAHIHDRMPVVLSREEEDRWVRPTESPAELLPLLQPFEESLMEKQPISTRINSPAHDDPDLLVPDAVTQ